MAISQKDIGSVLGREENLIDQTLTMACLTYHQAAQGLSEDPGHDELVLPSAGYMERMDRAIINLVKIGAAKAAIENPNPEDPEIAWAGPVRDKFKTLGRHIVEMRHDDSNQMFGEAYADFQRELYRAMIASTEAD